MPVTQLRNSIELGKLLDRLGRAVDELQAISDGLAALDLFSDGQPEQLPGLNTALPRLVGRIDHAVSEIKTPTD